MSGGRHCRRTAAAYAPPPMSDSASALWIVCYVKGQSVTGPYGTETIWDLSSDRYYCTDAWLWTDSNGAVVPHCQLHHQ